MSESYKVKIVGRRPLLMHRYVLEEEGTTRGRSGIHRDPLEDAKESLYRDASGAIALPSLNLKASFVDAAKQFKVPGRGRTTYRDLIKAGIVLSSEMIPLCNDGKDPETSWVVDTRPVVIQRARVPRSRPRFDEWALEFTVNIVDPIIMPAALKGIIEAAGNYCGLGDFRPEYGLYSVTGFEKC